MVVVVGGEVLIVVPWWYLKKWDISWRDGPATPKKKEYE
jgi:hypothetical protein